MANNLEVYIPYIINPALEALRPNSILANLVTKSIEPTSRTKGDRVVIPVPLAMTVSDVVPGPYAPTPADVAPTSVEVVLDKWKKSAFYVTQSELENIASTNLDPGSFIGSQIRSAAAAVANEIDNSIFALYKNIYNTTGIPGITPFASDPSDAQNCMLILDENNVPRGDRYMVLDPRANAAAVGLPQFENAQSYNNAIAITEGLMGRAIGFDWYYDQNLTKHTKGTSSGYLVNQANHQAGSNTVILDTGTGTILEGDIFTVAGDTQTYVVKSYAGTILTYEPAAKTNFADNAAVSFKANHTVNLAFHRMAFALALRPISVTIGNGPNSASMSLTDPVTKIPLQVTIISQYNQYYIEVSALWGVKTIRPECAVRLMG